MSNEFRLGYARSNSSEEGAIDNFGGATPVNLAAAMGAGSYRQAEPAISINFPGIGAPFMAIEDTKSLGRQWNLVDTASLLRGHHTPKFGVDYRYIKSPLDPPQIEPYAVFDDAQAVLSGKPDLPIVSSFLQVTPIFHQFALFAQDEWRAYPRLTLSYGLRWAVSPPPTEQHGNDAFTLRGNIDDPPSLTVAPRGTSLWHTSWYNFAPRLGAAWVVRDRTGSETILRGGGGVFFDSANEIAAVGFSGFGFRAESIPSGATLPYTPAQLNVPITTKAPYTSGIITAFPDHLQLPYTLEWNVSLQQELGINQVFTLSYVASAGRRLMGLQYRNIASLNPNFGTIQYLASNVTSNYQSLQAQFQRSVSKGLQALVSYTWSHAIDVGSQSTELELQRGNADYDVRQNLQAGLSWDLPGISHSRWESQLTNGWGLDARLISHTPFPITLGGATLTDPATGAQYNGGLNLVPDVPVYLHGSKFPGGKALNSAAFNLPAGDATGNAPRNFARGFGTTQLNLAVRRDFPIHDPLTLNFRAETFNLFNHPNFGYVDPDFTDATFGQATQMLNASLGTMASQYQQGGPRSMQFALRLSF